MLKKISFTLTLFFLLILLSYTSLLNTADASEFSQEKIITFLKNVAGINTTGLKTSINAESLTVFGGLSHEETDLTLSSNKDSLRVRSSFINGKFHEVYLSSQIEKLDSAKTATDPVDSAKNLIEQYEQYTDNPFYGLLASMLDSNVLSLNCSKTLGNIKLEISTFGDNEYNNIIWTFIDDTGIPAVSKNVVISYEHGNLKAFTDNWQLYKIESTPMLSYNDAVSLALNELKGFTWTAYSENNETVTVSDFKVVSVGNATLSYLNFNDEDSARNGDPFLLYPSWYIPIGFDQVYPGTVTGAIVRIWADTGELASIGTMSTGAIPAFADKNLDTDAASVNSLWILIPVVVSAIGLISACFYRIRLQKNEHLEGFPKIAVITLCILLSFSLLAAIPHANANRSRFYASSYGQTQMDMQYAGVLSGYITNSMSSAGYDSYNCYGYLTTWSQYQTNTINDQIADNFNIIFHFGHMAGQNQLKLSDGNVLTPTNVNSWVSQWEYGFIWLWACMQANGPNTGMPPAWADYSYFNSSDAYHWNDPYPYCFIGFENMSPSIYVGSFRYSTVQAWVYIEKVYDYLIAGYNVHDSLDLASRSVSTFNLPYDQSPLFAGFESWWPANYGDPPAPPGWYQGAMKVYGSSAVQLVW